MGAIRLATAPDGPGAGRSTGPAAGDVRTASLAALSVVVGGVLLTCVHYYGGTDGDPEGWFSAIGFATPFFTAGLLALIGVVMGAPWHWRSAGMALVPMSMVSIVLFPLLVPAVALFVYGLRHGSAVRDGVCGGALSAALIVTFGVLVFHQDPATWAGGSASNIVTNTEVALAVMVAVCVLVVAACVAAAPQRRIDEQRGLRDSDAEAQQVLRDD